MKLKSLILIFLFVALGCSSSYYPAPIVGGVDLQGPVKEEFLDRLRRNASMGQSLKALYRVKATSPEGRFSQRYSVLIKRPSHIRLDILPVNAAYTLASFGVQNDMAVFLSPSDHAALITKNFPRVIERALGFYMQPTELMNVFFGSVGAGYTPQSYQRLQLVRDNDYVWLVDGKFNYWKFDLSTKDPVYGHVRERTSDKVKYEVFYGDFVDQAGARIPKQVTLRIPQQELEIQANLTSSAVNMDIEDHKFEITIPPDYRIKKDFK